MTPDGGTVAAVEVGARIPSLTRTIRLVDMVAYAGATWDWHRLHYDRDHVADAGLSGPVVDGQMFGALLAEQVVDWLGPSARVRTLEFRFSAMVFAGETVVVEGEVTGVESEQGATTVTVAQRLTADDGKVAIDRATCRVEVPS